MKKILSVLLIICSISWESCYNYRDMNRLFFVLAAVVDVDDKGNIILYNETFKSYRGEGEKQGTEVKVIFKGTGITLYDAFSRMIESASFELDYTQVKALIFTERAARYGIDNFINAVARDQKPTLRQFLFVYPGDPTELLNIKMDDEQFLGLFLQNLMVSQGELVNVVQLRLNEYMNRRMMGSRTTAMPILKIINTAGHDRIEADGAAIIVDDKMVDKLNDKDVIPYNYVIKEARTGFLFAKNPQAADKFVSLKILSNNVRITLNYDGKAAHLVKNITTKVSLVDSPVYIVLSNDEIRKQIESDAEERTSNSCIELFEKFKAKGIDIYNVQREFEKKYPHEKVENVLAITSAITNVDIQIEGSNNTMNFQ